MNDNANDPQGWIASERDPESKYMNLCFRLYDPLIGRFLSVDPLFEMQVGINPYHYCGNDPVNASDPSGLEGIVRCQKSISVEGDGYAWEVYLNSWTNEEFRKNDYNIALFKGRMHNLDFSTSDHFNGLPKQSISSSVTCYAGPKAGNSEPKVRQGDEKKIQRKAENDLPEGIVPNSAHTFNDYPIFYFVNYSESWIKRIQNESYSKWKKNGNITLVQKDLI